jgi:hypothetical protein
VLERGSTRVPLFRAETRGELLVLASADTLPYFTGYVAHY